MNVLDLVNVSFQYRPRRPVFEGIDFSLSRGATALLGPNGAGKSTLLSLCATILHPTSGVITDRAVPSGDLRSRRSRLAWMPQDFEPAPGLTVHEHTAYAGWLKGMSRREARERAFEALEHVGLSSLAHRKTSQLSGGQKRRLGLAGALVHDAQIMLLDEPGAGLDPLQRMRFQELIAGIKADRTILVSTHQTEDISGAFDRVAVLAAGVIAFHGTVEEFIETTDPSHSLDPRDAVRGAYASFAPGED